MKPLFIRFENTEDACDEAIWSGSTLVSSDWKYMLTTRLLQVYSSFKGV